jgi:hypothetical protein
MQNLFHSLRRAGLLRVLVLCSLLALGLQSASAMSIRELRALENSDKKQGANYKRYYLVGAMEGALEAHEQGVRAGAKPGICLNGRRLLPSMAEGLYQTELQRNGDVYEADMPVPLVLANALATVYPC